MTSLTARHIYQFDTANTGAGDNDRPYAEMLVQKPSRLPALPSGWPAGRVRGLRARGGFEVAIDWSGGRLPEAEIASTLGGRARARYGDIVRDYTTQPGERIVFRP